jgi:hypothetical protein
MKIPVFVSSPTDLNDYQEASMKIVYGEIDRVELEPRTLGRSDYPTDLPLREVYVISRHCAGGIILGFEQFVTSSGIRKRGTTEEDPVDVGSTVKFPTPWNHLESGILYSFGLPMLVFKEDGISGGVFDIGATDVYVHKMPTPEMSLDEKKALSGVFLKWQSKVREFYYK